MARKVWIAGKVRMARKVRMAGKVRMARKVRSAGKVRMARKVCSVTNRYFQLSAVLYIFLIEPTLNEFGLYAFLKIAIFSDYINNSYKYFQPF